MEKRKFLCSVGGNVIGIAIMEKKKSIECLIKPKLGKQYDPAIPFLGIHQKKTQKLKHWLERMYAPSMFTAAWFTLAKIWK